MPSLGMTDEIGRLIGTSVVSFLLSFMLMRVWLPFAPKRSGEVLMQVPVGLVQRLLIYRVQAMWVLAFLLIASLPESFGLTWLQLLPGTQAFALAGIVLIISLPLRYVFYDRGVALSNGVPRPYKSFRRIEPRDIRPGRRWPLQGTTTVILRGRKTTRGSEPSNTLYLPGSQAQAVLRLLRKHFR
jgi:hypothetical protein